MRIDDVRSNRQWRQSSAPGSDERPGGDVEEVVESPVLAGSRVDIEDGQSHTRRLVPDPAEDLARHSVVDVAGAHGNGQAWQRLERIDDRLTIDIQEEATRLRPMGSSVMAIQCALLDQVAFARSL